MDMADAYWNSIPYEQRLAIAKRFESVLCGGSADSYAVLFAKHKPTTWNSDNPVLLPEYQREKDLAAAKGQLR